MVLKRHVVQSLLWAGVIGFALAAGGCRRTKDSFTSRTFHQMTSKFNPLFNGVEAYNKGVATVENGWKDDFTAPLPVYKWGDEKLAQSVFPDMDKAIEKGTKVIREHSMVISQKQKNRYVDDSYLLIGLARFYKMEYFKALETFNYVTQSFPKTDVYYEAVLWAARTQVELGNYYSAEDNLNLLYKNREVPKDLRVEVLATWAQMNTKRKMYEDALKNLEEALPLVKRNKELKVRLKFLQAQLFQLTGRGYEASQAYQAVAKMRPAYLYWFNAKLNRARTFDVYMEDPAIIFKELNKMLGDDKNRENRDQIYYVMAEISLRMEEYARAEDYLKKSIRTSVENVAQKGLSYLKLAEIDFEFKNYVRAQAYYDSAATSLPKDHPQYVSTERTRKSLNDLVENLNIIHLEDSLQALAALPSEQQMKVISGIIRKIEEEEERKKEEEELAKMNELLASAGGGGGNGPNAGAGEGGWYFYNISVRSSGFTDFLNRWGPRQLEDNWRRSNKKQEMGASEDFNAVASGSGEGDAESGEGTTGGPKDPNTYLSKLPADSTALAASHDRIIHAFQELGRIYKTELKDPEQAAKSLEELVKRYPGDPRMDRAWYALFLIYRDLGKTEKSQQALAALEKDFPGSRFTVMAKDPEAYERMQNQRSSEAEVAYLRELENYRKRAYGQALKGLNNLLATYSADMLVPRMELLRALCLGHLGREEEMMTALQNLSDTYPKDPAGIEALNYLMQLGGTAGAAAEDELFAFNLDKPHQYVLMVPVAGTDINRLRNTLTDYNTNFHRLEGLQLQAILLDETQHLLIVSGFPSAGKCSKYLDNLHLNEDMMANIPKEYKDFIISLDNFKTMYTQKKVEAYISFYNRKYKNLKS